MALKFSSVSGGSTQSGTTAERPASPSIGDQYYNGTLGRLEIYTGETTGWKAVGGEVRTPSVSGVTDVGTGRAFNNGAIDVTVLPNSDGGLPTSYTVTSTPGSIVTTGASPLRVTGLNSNTSYTFTATASNDYGSTSSVSATSSSATATTVPQAPTISTPTVVAGTAFGGSPSLDVPFSANGTGGKAITSYTVTSSPGSFTATGASSPLRVSGLTGGTNYTFTVTATNANGTSLPSSASSSFAAATAPGIATLGTAVISAANKAGIPYTINNGGSAITSWSVGISPSISGSPTITFDSNNVYVESANWAFNQAYTFTLTATNAAGTGGTSSSSNELIVVKAYNLTQTYTSSTTYTVPSGTGKLAVYAFSGSSAGGSGGGTSSGGAGGNGARGIAISEYSVTPGQNFAITVGASGGTTNFGNILSVSPNAGNSNVAGSVSAAGGAGAPASSSNGNNGSAGGALTLNQAGLTTHNAGGGGAGGGAGRDWAGGCCGNYTYGIGTGGFGAGTNFTPGGAGGGGGFTGNQSDYGAFNYGSSGGSGSSGTFTGNTGGNGGGGGGGYGTAYGSRSAQWPFGNQSNDGAGGAGTTGKVLIYES